MKSKYLPIMLLVVVVINSSSAQHYKGFGSISLEDFETTHAGTEKPVDAFVMFDVGRSEFILEENFFEILFKRSTRIKIETEAGIKWADIEIPFYIDGSTEEKVFAIEAYTYNIEDGQLVRTKFDPSNCFETKLNERWKTRKFTMPNVQVGSIIEYKYQIQSPFKFNLIDWSFQWKIPVVYSEYLVRMIPFYEYAWILQGADKFDVYDSYKDKGLPRNYGQKLPYSDNTYYDMVYKFGMKDVPPFDDEEFITSMNDYIMKIDFQLCKIIRMDGSKSNIVTSWPALVKDMLKHDKVGNYQKKCKWYSKEIFNKEEFSGLLTHQVFDTILNYVKSNFTWNGYKSKYATKKPKDFLNQKTGNCAEINLFTIALLNANGIEAYPVLLSTRDHGKVRLDYPYVNSFNYIAIMALVNNKAILTDATDIHCKNNRIPPNCINDKGLILNKKNNALWVNLACKFPSAQEYDISIELSGDSLKSDIRFAAKEYEALMFRKAFGKDYELIIKKLEENDYDVIDSSVEVSNYLKNEEPYRLKYSVHHDAEIINNKVYIAPFLNEVLEENPLKQSSRSYPLDMTYPKKIAYQSSIAIPEGYEVDFLPSNEKIENDYFDMDYVVFRDEKHIRILFSYYFKKAVYPSNAYSQIKYYYKRLIEKGNDRVVLVIPSDD